MESILKKGLKGLKFTFKIPLYNLFYYHPGMAPTTEFGMEKMTPTPKMNNKVEGTPKPESKKVKVKKTKKQSTR